MYVYYCRTYEKAVNGGGGEASDLRRVYVTPFLEWAGGLPLAQASKREEARLSEGLSAKAGPANLYRYRGPGTCRSDSVVVT